MIDAEPLTTEEIDSQRVCGDPETIYTARRWIATLAARDAEIERLKFEHDAFKSQLDDLAAGMREMREAYEARISMLTAQRREASKQAFRECGSIAREYWRKLQSAAPEGTFEEEWR